MRYFYFTGININNISMHEALEEIKKWIEKGKPSYVVTPNAAHIVCLKKDKEFRMAYQNASLVLPDGISLIWASILLGAPLKKRCAGSDLFAEICRIAERMGKRIFLLGGTNGSEGAAAARLKKLFPKLGIGYYSPPFGFEHNENELKTTVDMINRSKADILFLCVGSPKSEKLIWKNIDKLNVTLSIAVGASLDFIAGRVKRAPPWMQRIGMEWFFRLIQEPRRLYKRYLIGNSIFLYLLLKELYDYKKGKVLF